MAETYDAGQYVAEVRGRDTVPIRSCLGFPPESIIWISDPVDISTIHLTKIYDNTEQD